MSGRPVLLTLDLGTTNCKAAAFDLSGAEIVRVAVSYPTYTPAAGAHLQRPAEWLAAARQALSETAKALGDDIARTTGLALSAWGPGLVLLSSAGEVLNEFSPTWQDFRSQSHGERLISELGPGWIGGGMPTSGFPAKLAWAMEEWPALTRDAAFALGVKDLLLYWLTGEIATEPSSGPYGDRWPAEVFSFIGWATERLPPVLPPTSIAGHLLSARASELGLPAGLPVVMGLNDGASATLGAGCRRAGDGVISLGTNGVLRVVTDRQPATEDCLIRALFRYPFVDDLWVTGGFALSGGDALRWLVEAFTGTGGEQAYRTALDDAARVPPGSDGVLFLPYLIGRGSPAPDPSASGAFVGLRSSHGRGHLVRAVLEGVTYALYDISSALDDLGRPLEHLAITGGGARAALWRSIIADVFGRSVHHAVGDSNLGAAMVLTVALQLHSSFDDAVARMTSPVPVQPSGDAAPFAKGYAQFRDTAARLAPV